MISIMAEAGLAGGLSAIRKVEKANPRNRRISHAVPAPDASSLLPRVDCIGCRTLRPQLVVTSFQRALPLP
jgi:hypothetical protein